MSAQAPAAASGLSRYVNLFGSIRPYQRSWLSRDVVAGITLAALAIPEVMGYTKIAGTPVITGLYTILIPIIAFSIFGSSRHLVVGGDSATAAIMFAGIASLGIAGLQPYTSQWLALASLSALIAAGFLLLARLARLGFLANFISRTVLIGLLTGAIPTTAKCCAQALDELLKRPAELQRAQAAARAGDDRLMARYVFEALRFNPNNPGLFRIAAEDCVLAEAIGE